MYPPDINKRVSDFSRSALNRKPEASGRAATFVCGVYVEFELSIDSDTGTIEDVLFRSNGCGFAIAAADLCAQSLKGVKLVDLHALHDLEALVFETLGRVPAERRHCFDLSFDALGKALADYRLKLVGGWNGEDALICSCFGISEAAIEDAVTAKNLVNVEEVGEICRAGTGCGSCQPLVQEILDAQDR